MTEPKRLYRDRQKAMLGGVAAGLAEYLHVDVTLVRVAWVLLTVFTGFVPGGLAYILLWLLVPEKPEGPAPRAAPGPAP